MDSDVDNGITVGLEPPNSDASNSEFTQANLIGLFLTLSLCLLTQPWGSLLYRPLDKDWAKFARILFFIWRLHPIACAAETVIILVCYVYTALETRRYCLDAQRRFTFSDVLDGLHITSIALLLLRANDDRDGPVEEVLEDKLSSAPFSTGVTEDTQVEGGLDAMTVAAQGSAVTSAEPTRGTGLLRRGTTQLESAMPLEGATSPSPGTTDARNYTSALKTALNTAVLGHKEKWLDIMATFSAFTVTVKLFSTSFPWPFRTAALFLLSGWYAVQSLLWLFHRVDNLDDDAKSVVEPVIVRAKRLRAVIMHPLSILVIHLATLPLLLYISYAIGFSFEWPSEKSEFWAAVDDRPEPRQYAGVKLDGRMSDDLSMAKFVIYMPLTLPIISISIFLFIVPLLVMPIMLVVALVKIHRDFQGFAFILIFSTVIAEMFILASFPTQQYALLALYSRCGALSISAGLVLYMVAALPFRFLRSKRIGDTGRATGLCCSIIAWAYIFVFAVEYYDGTGSHKPGWLEYLG
ncbi:hypothetical protein V8F20_003524 [Naviculisporaceae sp. PSN 640]